MSEPINFEKECEFLREDLRIARERNEVLWASLREIHAKPYRAEEVTSRFFDTVRLGDDEVAARGGDAA
jgi:hypothetical protein